jgi:hypothetical protein
MHHTKLGRTRSRWEDIIKTDIKEYGRAPTGLIWYRIGTSIELL